ncbi:MAG TPA: hypothetical protein PLX69_20300 [Leptospiraceae bacterium]|nr:hypothetical protein [Leptospiraceae bacterium]HRG76911.1 hypothetical protein [Leptospiraceae bacterium]
MRVYYFLIFIFFLTCIMRVDWGNGSKPPRVFTYDHPHDGNLTKAEIAKNSDSSSSNGMYKIKTQDEIMGPRPNNCVSKLAKCMSDCNKNYDINSSLFALKVAIIQAKRATCFDECYNDVTPGCDYPLKRIQY